MSAHYGLRTTLTVESAHMWKCCTPRVAPSARLFTHSARLVEKQLPPRKVITESEITESFLKGTGPGGQKINKTSSAVQLKHLPSGLVVKSQHTRSRDQNRKYARQILAEKLEEIEKGDQSRTAIKAERARTKKASADKKKRRKYRELEEEKRKGGEASARDGDESASARRDATDSSESVEMEIKGQKK